LFKAHISFLNGAKSSAMKYISKFFFILFWKPLQLKEKMEQ
jgi:hypothetical protein